MNLRHLALATSLAALVAAGSGSTAGAREVSHRVTTGESLASIAMDYYGSEQAAELLRHHNGLGGDAPLLLGSTLRVPLPDEQVVEAPTTWPSLAQSHWGNGELGTDLAEMNGSPARSPVAAGTRVRLPLLVTYQIQPGNNMIRLARRFYGSNGHAAMIKRLNRKENASRLLIGERLSLPAIAYHRPVVRLAQETPLAPAPTVTKLVATPEPTAAPSAEVKTVEIAPVASPPPAEDLRRDLRHGVNAYLDGRYAESLEKLEELRPTVLARGDAKVQAELLSHLVFLYVAFEHSERACESYRALREIDGRPAWDPDFVSPKILRAIAACGS